jgi:FAD/FMN-containing dehydrogenase
VGLGKAWSTYRNHGHQDEAGRGSLAGAVTGVDESVARRRRQDKTGAEITNDGNMVRLGGVGGDDDEDADDSAQHVDERPPREARERSCPSIALYMGNN